LSDRHAYTVGLAQGLVLAGLIVCTTILFERAGLGWEDIVDLARSLVR